MQKQQRGLIALGIDPGIANTRLAIVSHDGCKPHLIASSHIKITACHTASIRRNPNLKPQTVTSLRKRYSPDFCVQKKLIEK